MANYRLYDCLQAPEHIAREAMQRGLCLPQNSEPVTATQAVAPALQASALSAPRGEVGFPFPLLIVGFGSLVFAGLSQIKKRKYSNLYTTQKDLAYGAVMNLPDSVPQYAFAGVDTPTQQSAHIPPLEEVKPPRHRDIPGVTEPSPWDSDTLATPTPTPVSSPSDTPLATPQRHPLGEVRFDPLSLCPFDIKQFPSMGEKKAVEWLIYEDTPQNQIIQKVWGLSKNGREGSPYQLAKARYEGYLEAWSEKWKL